MLRTVAPATAGILVWFSCLACATHEPLPRASAMPENLVLSVQAETAGDTVRFTLQVTNAGTAPVELTFPTGQTFDFVVRDGDREVWRWSQGRMFTQMLQTVTLAAGETQTYTATWAPPAGLSGNLQVFGTLTALDHRVQQGAHFRLP